MMTLLLNRILKQSVGYRLFKAMGFSGVMLLSFAAYAQPMSGTYTVCPGGSCNFTTVAAAASALNANGVSGAVTINVAAGTYTNSVTVNNISGASSTNTIKFKGAGKNSTKIVVSSGQALYLNYSQYVTFEDFHFENTGGTYCVYNYYAQRCTLRNNNIKMRTYNGNVDYPLYHNYCQYMTYDGNTVYGGYYAMYMIDNGLTAGTYHTIKNNRVTNFYYYGMYLQSQNCAGYNLIEANYVDSALSGSGYGIMAYYQNRATIRNNYVAGNGINYGLYLYYPNYYNYSGSVLTEVYNNILVNSGSGYPLYAYCYYANYIKISHNTIHGKGSPTYTAYVYAYTGPFFEFTNNSLTRSSGGNNGYIYINNSSRNHWGNNYYDGTSSPGFYWNGVSYSGLSAFVAASGEKNASSVAMPFKSSTDFHLDQSSPAPSGLYSGIDKDMDGDGRCMLFPTPGADESTFGKGAFKAQFFVPSIVYDQSPVVFYNFAKQGEPKIHRWYIDGVYVDDTIHLATALTGTSHVVSLVTEGCAGKDSTWKTVTITTPPVVPVSDFISNQNIFPQGGIVRFSDLSTYGPSSWQWEITPEQTYVGGVLVPRYKYLYGTSATSQNPVVQFTASGKYKVCMTATNTKGSGNKECKVDYIEVTPQINMGQVSETNASQGLLFDSGGPNAEPTTLGDTKLLINACASDVYLVFNKFDMMCGYNYIRVYDGEVEDDAYALHPCTTNAQYNGSTGLTGGTTYAYCYSGGTSERCIPKMPGNPIGTDTFHAKSGKMLIVQDINYQYTGYGQGFEASWWSTPKAFTAPVASFEVDTTICQNGLLTFKNTSQGDDIKYNWDLDGDLQTFEATDDDETQWLFTIPGKQTVTLIAQNCGGVDTFQQTINVFVPNKPTVAFTASNASPTPADVVFFTNQITECVDDYEWTFARSSGKPGTVTFMNGTSKFSDNPAVMFSDTGCWNATLVVTNSGGTSTLKKTCVVNVKESYCVPSVATMSKDVGISEVNILASADSSVLMHNQSPQAVKDYTNYVNDPKLATGLEIGVTYLVEVKRTSNANSVTRNIWIDWNLDGDFNDPQEEVAVETNAKTQSWIANFTVPIIAKTGASVMRVAINTGQFSNEVCGQNRFGEYEDYRVELSNDRTAPIITLYGPDGLTKMPSGDTIVIEQGRKYTEWGFKAIDNLDGDVTSSVTSDTMTLPNGPTGNLNTFVVRNYRISYNVQDASANNGAASRIIKVITDTTAPTLMIGGSDVIRHNVDDAANFQMPQVISVNDLVDGIQVNMVTEIYNNGAMVQSLDPAVVDTYTVVFRATDAAGNVTEITRTVIIEDVTDPMLALMGDNPVNHPVGVPYSDAGATPSDNYWTGQRLTDGMSASDYVDYMKIGTYTYEYTLTDPSGNGPITAVRTVNVVDEVAPLAYVEGEDTMYVEVMTKFQYPSVSYSDNYFDNNDLTVEWLGTLMPTISNGVLTQLGTYTLQFVVTDPSNNVTTIEKVVVVDDNTAPHLTLIGDEAIDLCRWEEYEDEGYNMKDNFYANSTIVVTKEGTFISKGETNLPGLYSFRYKAEDGSGNIGYSPYRTILVKSENEYPCYMNGIEDAASLEKMVNVYPNPSTGNFTVKIGFESQQQLRISVMNLLGEELVIVKDGQVLSDVYNVDLSTQASGVYMLKVQGADFSFTKRLVIQK